MLSHLKGFLVWLALPANDSKHKSEPDWPAVYKQLDSKHGLAQRGINLYLFLRDPERYEYWIRFYFANLVLFTERVGLHFFLTHDPAHIVKVLQASSRKPLVSELLCSSQLDFIYDSGIDDIPVRVTARKPMRDVTFRDGRYIQPVNKHRINPHRPRMHDRLYGLKHE